MPAKWKDILANKTSYPDDFSFQVGAETMTLGQMRNYDTEHEGELTKHLTAREQKLVERETTLDTATKQVGALLEKVATNSGLTVEELVTGKTPSKKVVAAAADLDENDPLVGTLVKELKSLKQQNTELSGKVENLSKNALGPMLNTYLEDFYETRWDKLAGDLPKGSKLTREQALEYAQKSGYKDSKNRWDLAKAIKDLTYDDRVKAEAQRMADDIRKKDEDSRILGAVQKPNSLGAKIKPDKSVLNSKGQVKSLDEALNDAMSDTDLWRGISHQVQ